MLRSVLEIETVTYLHVVELVVDDAGECGSDSVRAVRVELSQTAHIQVYVFDRTSKTTYVVTNILC